MKLCTYCNSTTHTVFYCRSKPRVPMKRSKAINDRTYLSDVPQTGKAGQQAKNLLPVRKGLRREAIKTRQRRQAVSQAWFDANPPDEFGYWRCYLRISPNCHKQVDRGTINLEHVRSKARHPEDKYNVRNLKPACPPCNALKGSRDLEEVSNGRND